MINVSIFSFIFGFCCINAAQHTPQQLDNVHTALAEPHALSTLLLGSDQNSPFEKVHEDVHCNDAAPFHPPFFSSKVKSMKDCKAECTKDPRCAYMAFWLKTKKCETYFTCYSQIRDGSNRITLYKRVSICEQDRDKYYNLIAREFPRDIIRPLYMPFEWQKNAPRSNHRQPNFHCYCTGIGWMTCGVFATENTPEFEMFDDRFAPTDKEKMKPFFVFASGLSKYGGEKDFLAFAEKKSGVKLFAELQLFQFIPNNNWNTMTNPGCIHIRQCVEGTPGGIDPVQLRPFESGEPVYLMRDDAKYIGTNHRIACISVRGMRSHLMEDQCLKDGGFQDPLGRQPATEDGFAPTILTIEEFYHMFYIFDDAAMGTGICAPQGKTPTKAPTTVKQKEESAHSLSVDVDQMREYVEQMTLDGGSGDEDFLPPGYASFVQKSKSKGKKKKKKPMRGERQLEPLPQDPGSAGMAGEAGPSGISHFSPSVLSPELSATSPTFSGEPGSSEEQSDDGLILPPFAIDASTASIPDSGSANLIMPKSGSPDKPKLVLSNSDMAKIRRSFEEAKARREGKKPAHPEEHIAKAPLQQSEKEIMLLFACCALITLFWRTSCFYIPSEENVYLEFSS